MTNTDKIAMIRDAFPVVRERTYFNTGWVGPISTITTSALHEEQEFELVTGRATSECSKRKQAAKQTLRNAFARLTKADPEQIALTQHTTAGVNIAIHGLNWQAGEEIVSTNLEHPGGILPPYVVARRHGVTVKVIEIGPQDTPAEIVARFEAAITRRTRVFVFSHVAWNLGIRLPLEEIVALGHRHEILSFVDAAQAAGSIPLDLSASKVDAYAMPGQKWLCGPEGVGGLYVRKDRLNELAPTVVGASSTGPGGHDWSGYFMPGPGARRYEVGTANNPLIAAMAANMTWLENEIGWDWIYNRIAHLADYLRSKLQATAGITLITPPGPNSGLTSFQLDGYDSSRVLAKLNEENIILRTLSQPHCLRVSTGFYNDEGDIDRLLEVLQAIMAGEPENLPVA